MSSVGGHIVLIVSCKNRSAPIAWSSSKIKPVERSTLAAEALSLSEALDHAIYLKQIVMELTSVDGDSIPIEAFVDNQSVEDALYSRKLVDDRRLRIDIGSIKQMLTVEDVANIQWIPGDKMIANGLTKQAAQTYHLLRTVQEQHLVRLHSRSYEQFKIFAVLVLYIEL